MQFLVAQAVLLLGPLAIFIEMRHNRKKEALLQSERHIENVARLRSLRDFQINQIKVNEYNGELLRELQVQTVKLTEMAAGQTRRLEMLENRA